MRELVGPPTFGSAVGAAEGSLKAVNRWRIACLSGISDLTVTGRLADKRTPAQMARLVARSTPVYVAVPGGAAKGGRVFQPGQLGGRRRAATSGSGASDTGGTLRGSTVEDSVPDTGVSPVVPLERLP